MATPAARASGPAERELRDSPLFDDAWYCLLRGVVTDRERAVRHYLDAGSRQGLTPHPLFVPSVAAASLHEGAGEAQTADEDPLVEYLRRRDWTLPVHPLVDVDRYLTDHPEARQHEWGPLGHYVEVGAPGRLRPNDWYRPTPDEPRGLVDWLWADAARWAERRDAALPVWSRRRPRGGEAGSGMPVHPSPDVGTFSVVLVIESLEGAHRLDASVRSLQAQEDQDWELVVAGVAAEPDLTEELHRLPRDPRIRTDGTHHATRWAARNHAARAARGTHVAFMLPGDVWLPGRLRALRGGLAEDPTGWGHDCARDERPGVERRFASRRLTAERVAAGGVAELGTLVFALGLWRDLGGFRESLPGGHVTDLLMRALALGPGVFVPRVGVSLERTPHRTAPVLPLAQRPYVDLESTASANDVALNETLVDWAALSSSDLDRRLASVVIPTHHDWFMTRRAVECVMAADDDGSVEVVVVDNGAPAVTSAVLESLTERFEGVRVVHSAVNRGFALGNNIAVPHLRGGTAVFLNNDTEVQPGWLAPLRRALDDDGVLAAQSLLLFPSGTVQSAGAVFPPGDAIAHELLKGFPSEDARALGAFPHRALTGAALALRHDDVVALRGFDPVFRNGMEDVDLCLRLGELRSGRFALCPESVVVHHESESPGRFSSALVNRRIFLQRWHGRLPSNDGEAWRACGFEVTGHRLHQAISPDTRLCAVEPVLRRTERLQVAEGPPSLRWALKNPAPAGPKAESWGDTHVLRQLAAALRRLGQEVVIDHRPALDRTSGWLDDVVVSLRGRVAYRPLAGRVNLMWLLSHPDKFEGSGHLGWDLVYVASVPFAERLAAKGVPAVPLLQATDPSLFHPDLSRPDTGEEVLFVGNSRFQRRPMVTWAVEQGLPLTVYGGDWEGLIPSSVVRARHLPNHEVGSAYRAAGVVLNDHWADMAEHGFLSNRLFDAVASGARVVSDPVPGMEEVFGSGVQVAHDAAGLASLVSAAGRARFGTDSERRERAALVAREHSYDARAAVMLDDALATRRRRGLHLG